MLFLLFSSPLKSLPSPHFNQTHPYILNADASLRLQSSDQDLANQSQHEKSLRIDPLDHLLVEGFDRRLWLFHGSKERKAKIRSECNCTVQNFKSCPKLHASETTISFPVSGTISPLPPSILIESPFFNAKQNTKYYFLCFINMPLAINLVETSHVMQI